ncbi:hypothetical protein LAP8965_03191 [Lactiplantibacillus plantarum]|nr:hypothetical protein LAP8963_03129 [Lactiplantibacillus plantarum]SPE13676.1 hypothetical protein LAP8964_03071 [Lactiplantibacillus plantarum]SPH08611.1 hypothetical protein LAP8965_03191 [Lactiplantibacillus plantarum]SPH10935.1 hypothetical protein LAP8966_03149 [Lactiplantibacillus plantarum]
MINHPKQRSKLIYQHQRKHQYTIKAEQCMLKSKQRHTFRVLN